MKDARGPLHRLIAQLPLVIVDSAPKENVIGTPISVCKCSRLSKPLVLLMVPVKLFSGQVKLCQAQVTLISVAVGAAGAATWIELFVVY